MFSPAALTREPARTGNSAALHCHLFKRSTTLRDYFEKVGIMKKFIIFIAVCIGVYGLVTHAPDSFSINALKALFPFTESGISTSDKAIKNAYENRLSGIQIGGSGKVIKILPDDDDGRRHQRFIIQLESRQTLLIAHNIDLAPKINNLQISDLVSFYGEYEWNAKGGVVHWTHHDPNNRHEGGWLNHGGKLYQ